MSLPEPVLGPDRPRAAVKAIAELQAAKAALNGWVDSPIAVARYREALRVRAHYPEYGDTFRGH